MIGLNLVTCTLLKIRTLFCDYGRELKWICVIDSHCKKAVCSR